MSLVQGLTAPGTVVKGPINAGADCKSNAVLVQLSTIPVLSFRASSCGQANSYAPKSTVPPEIRGLPSRSGPTGAQALNPALMQGDRGRNRRFSPARSTNSGSAFRLPIPFAGRGSVQQKSSALMEALVMAL